MWTHQGGAGWALLEEPHDDAEPGDSALRSAESEKTVCLQAPVAIVTTDGKGQNPISIAPLSPLASSPSLSPPVASQSTLPETRILPL